MNIYNINKKKTLYERTDVICLLEKNYTCFNRSNYERWNYSVL